MLHKIQHLKKDSEIKAVLHKGRHAASAKLTIKWLENEINFTKLTLVVSKKVDNRATKRNQIRRVIREHLRQHYLLKTGNNIVIIVKPGAANLDNKQLRQELDKVLSKSQIIRNKA